MLMGKENWPELSALTSIFSVELPGIEPAALPGNVVSEMPVGSASFPFSPVRYLRVRFRVLTASRAATDGSGSAYAPITRHQGDAGSMRKGPYFCGPFL